MKITTKETELQKVLLAYDCPSCGGSQLITKPHPKADKNNGCAIFTSVVSCLNNKCNSKRKVRRYPNGTYRSFKINSIKRKNHAR